MVMAVFIGREIAISSTSRLNTGPEVAGCRWCDDGGDHDAGDDDDAAAADDDDSDADQDDDADANIYSKWFTGQLSSHLKNIETEKRFMSNVYCWQSQHNNYH